MLGRMSRRMPHGDDCFAEGETVAVPHLLMVKSVASIFFVADENFCRAYPLAQFARATYKIRMDVCLKNVGNRDLLLAGELEIFLHIGRRIEHGGDAIAVIAKQVGKFSDAFSLDAFKD